MVGWTSLYTRATMNTAIVIAPSTRPRSRACDSVWRRPIQTSAADPIAKTTSTVQCDGLKAENCRVAEIGAKSAVAIITEWVMIRPFDLIRKRVNIFRARDSELRYGYSPKRCADVLPLQWRDTSA